MHNTKVLHICSFAERTLYFCKTAQKEFSAFLRVTNYFELLRQSANFAGCSPLTCLNIIYVKKCNFHEKKTIPNEKNQCKNKIWIQNKRQFNRTQRKKIGIILHIIFSLKLIVKKNTSQCLADSDKLIHSIWREKIAMVTFDTIFTSPDRIMMKCPLSTNILLNHKLNMNIYNFDALNLNINLKQIDSVLVLEIHIEMQLCALWKQLSI